LILLISIHGRHQVVSDLKYFKIKFKPISLVFTILKVTFLNSLIPKMVEF